MGKAWANFKFGSPFLTELETSRQYILEQEQQLVINKKEGKCYQMSFNKSFAKFAGAMRHKEDKSTRTHLQHWPLVE